MTEMSRKSTPAAVPYAVTRGDRIPVQRYYDPEFYALERDKLWSRVWQMAISRPLTVTARMLP